MNAITLYDFEFVCYEVVTIDCFYMIYIDFVFMLDILCVCLCG